MSVRQLVEKMVFQLERLPELALALVLALQTGVSSGSVSEELMEYHLASV